MPHRIIVVDDDTSILELLKVILESEGYSVQTFASAPAALKASVKNPPDAAIVDLMMPGMDGIELLRAFRYNSKTRDLPILLCSAYYENLSVTVPEMRQSTVRRLRKPFHVQELLEMVDDMITGRRPRKTARGKRTAQRGDGGPGQVSAFAASPA